MADETAQSNLGIGFEPVVDPLGNIHVRVHINMGMLQNSFTLPEIWVDEFANNLRNCRADAAQLRKKMKGKALLGPDGMAIMPDYQKMEGTELDELRANVLKAAETG